jgi:hypothetical protein
MMRYDGWMRYSSRQAALDDAGVRGIPSPTPGRQDVDLTSLYFHMLTLQLHILHFLERIIDMKRSMVCIILSSPIVPALPKRNPIM